MKKVLWILFAVGIAATYEPYGLNNSESAVLAAEPVRLRQVVNVPEVSSVQPGDWAFTALQRLMEEYSCLDGYANLLFRGNRAITRYEFARGINVCLDVVIQTINQKDDFDTIRRLQEEFAAELSILRS
ncbi:MAG: iron uptake porin [Cyanobacteria bacterium J06573_11]